MVRTLDGTITFWNRGAEETYGWTEAEALGEVTHTLLQTQFPTSAAQVEQELLTEGRWEGELTQTTHDKRPIVVASRQVVQYDAQDQPTDILEINADSTERKRAEDEIRASQAHLAGVVSIAEDAIISVDGAQRITMFNQGAEKIFGYTASEVLHQPLETLLPARFHAIHRQHVANFGAAPYAARMMGERREIWGRRKNGAEFPAEASISKLTVGKDSIFTVILRDITERKRAAEELERQVHERTAHLNALLQFSNELLLTRSPDEVLERLLRHALALVPDAQRGVIYLADQAGGRLALRASTGFNPLPPIAVPANAGCVGRAFTTRQMHIASSTAEVERMLTDEADRELWQQGGVAGALPTGAAMIPLMTHDQPIGVLLLLRESGSGPFAVDAHSTLAGLANLAAAAIVEEQSQQTAAALAGQLAQLAEQQRTLSERLNSAEAGMLQAARLAAVGQLAASIAHEINNPLYAARNALYLIEEDLPDELRSSPYVRMVSDQLTRIAGIIERMRDFYRPPRGELAPYDVNQLLEETLALAGLNMRHGTMQMIFSPARDLPLVECNGDQLRQVFLNLVLNAIEAMPEGGTLTVRTIAGPTVAIIEIQDTGIGIPEDIRVHLFEPFFTNKPHGTGLGLSISAHIVTQHGGQIEVDSTSGQGSTFRVVLPYQSHR
jgi:two-component system NtrC family sensor kinase